MLYDDVVPFLESLRAAGVPTAFVSNCAENTRPLLDSLGLSDLVDHLVLSCEIGAAKAGTGDLPPSRSTAGGIRVRVEAVVRRRPVCRYCERRRQRWASTSVRIDLLGGSGQVSSLADLVSEAWISLP